MRALPTGQAKVIIGIARRQMRLAQMPFAAQARVIASPLQIIEEGLCIAKPIPFADFRDGFFQPIVNADLGGGLAGEQAGARWRAYRRRRVGMFKARPQLGQGIQSRRMRFVIAIAASGPSAVVISEKEQDIRLSGHGGSPVRVPAV